MALGRIKWVENLDPRFGADDSYWLVKVQADYSGRAEEYWLVTAEERQRFAERGARNEEDPMSTRIGVFTVVANTDRKVAREARDYFGVLVKTPEGSVEKWFLTDHDLERVRERVEARKATVEANASNWLADLLD